MRIHLIREIVGNSKLNVGYVPSEENDADILTKPVGPIVLQRTIRRIGIKSEIEEVL